MKLSENDDCVHGSYFWTLDTFLSLLSSDDWGDHAPLTPCAWSLTTGGNVSRAGPRQLGTTISCQSALVTQTSPTLGIAQSSSPPVTLTIFVRANMPRK